MPIYWDAKQAVLDFLDACAPEKNLPANYLHPLDSPKYKAATKLQELGLGGSALAKRRGELNTLLRERFGEAWKRNIGQVSIDAVGTIGELVTLVAARLKLELPAGEPR